MNIVGWIECGKCDVGVYVGELWGVVVGKVEEFVCYVSDVLLCVYGFGNVCYGFF